jgi:hypothetical protein
VQAKKNLALKTLAKKNLKIKIQLLNFLDPIVNHCLSTCKKNGWFAGKR